MKKLNKLMFYATFAASIAFMLASCAITHTYS